MLVAFFKSHEDKRCECEIVKFVDRIWLGKSGDLEVIRTFIIYVKEGSDPLSEIRMLVPFRQTPDLFDLSHTCLQQDYLFNSRTFSTGGFKIDRINAETHGIITYDFFKTEVFTNNRIKSFDSPNKTARIIAIAFSDHPIKAENFRLFRLTFKVTSVLDKLFPRVYSLKLNYFDKSLFVEDCEKLGIQELEVPANKVFDPRSKQGGFDIFLYLAEGRMSSTNFNASTQTTARHMPDGTDSGKLSQKFIWRARLIFPSDETKLLRCEETKFSIEGLISDPYELEELRGKMSILEIGQVKIRRSSIIALILAIASIVLMFIGKDWIISCFSKVFK